MILTIAEFRTGKYALLTDDTELVFIGPDGVLEASRVIVYRQEPVLQVQLKPLGWWPDETKEPSE